ncbi:vacuolar membrane-associated protein iml1 [Actinomortierella ambigua]|uniref:Vacuolar membrane-associated protein IML1 n=1 Tax=Actinomortierella ambigua TaxID=1343610 RepID=A0A9P6Q0A4_9FUNG|nr:vacuolar membrane-associated protein iml1 [Actinomortierella ambigua]
MQPQLQQQQVPQSQPTVPTKILRVHNDHFSKSDFLLDPAFFPNAKPGDLFEIYDPSVPKEPAKRLVMQWAGTDKDTPHKVTFQVSLASNIAEAFGLSPRQEVVVKKVDASAHEAHHVEVTFRDQYVGRSDMWRLRTSLVGSCVYEAKKILFAGCIRVQVKEIHVGGQTVPSGYITADTKIIFRSESAKYFIFLQMSREMWEFDEDGEIHFEKVIFGFLPNLFSRWRGKRDGKTELETPTNHVVSVVLFSRIFYQGEEEARFHIGQDDKNGTGLQQDERGRYYQDFYKVVIDWEARTDWTTAIIPLKEEVMKYQRDILLRPAGEYEVVSGENSYAFEGNVLEAVNMALNPFDKHYVDRDLQRTGLSIVIITPGSGVFDVDKRLLRMTTERMISSGIGLDLVCLSKVPAHIVPLFRWKGPVTDGQGSTHASSNPNPPGPTNTNVNTNANAGGGHGNTNQSSLMVRSTSAYSRPNSRPPSIKELPADTRNTSWSRSFKQSSPSTLPEVQLDMSDPLYYDAPPTFPTPSARTYYYVPHWIDCIFYVSTQQNPQKFYTRCKMYELQMMGIMEHDIANISIPYLNEGHGIHYAPAFGKKLSSSDALISRSNLSRGLDYDKHDEELFRDPKSPIEDELRLLRLANSTNPRGTIRDALSMEPLDGNNIGNISSARLTGHGTTTGNFRRLDDHFASVRQTKGSTSELSRSLPRAWNTTMIMASTAIPENPNMHNNDAPTPGKVSFSLKSANGFLEESRAQRQSEKMNRHGDAAEMETDDHRRHRSGGGSSNGRGANDALDDAATEPAMYGRSVPHVNVDIKSKTGHHRASTDDDPGFLSSSTVKPIYISQSQHNNVEDMAPSEISGAESCHTGSLSSERGYRGLAAANTNGGIGGGAGGGVGSSRTGQTRQRSKQTYVYPFNPSKTVVRMTSQLRRWQHAFPRTDNRSSSLNLIRSDVYMDTMSNTEPWRGLLSPASLPLTTDYFPSRDELQELYQEWIHTITPSEDTTSYSGSDMGDEQRRRAVALMRELIYHRLAQGFQLIVRKSGTRSSPPAGGEDKAITYGTSDHMHPKGQASEPTAPVKSNALIGGGAVSTTAGNKPQDYGLDFFNKDKTCEEGSQPAIAAKPGSVPMDKRTKDKAVYLSTGHQVHKLSIDSSEGNVEVKRYERRLGYKQDPIKYQCVIWPMHMPGYMSRELTFKYPLLSHYQWNYLDHLVSGYQDELTEDLLYWRTRFILIPAENVAVNSLTNVQGEHLDDEELRLTGFQKFLDLFQKAKWSPRTDGNIAPKRQESSVKVQLITCSFAAWAFSELAKAEEDQSHQPGHPIPTGLLPEPERLNKHSKIQAIATAIQNPMTGIKLQDRRWHLRVYNSVFLGNEVVDWLIHNFVDIETREEAIDFGKKLFDKGLFIHCLGKHHFIDGHYFYQFSGEYAPSTKQSSRGWFRNTRESLTKRDVELDKLRSSSSDVDHSSAAEKSNSRKPPNSGSSVTGTTNTAGGPNAGTTGGGGGSGGGGTGVASAGGAAIAGVAGVAGGGAATAGSGGNHISTGGDGSGNTAVAAGISAAAVGQTNATSTVSAATLAFRERMEKLQKMAPTKKVEMSRTIIIDVDPNKRSDRRETAVLHYDLAHNVKHCYHFQLHWLGCTARLIEDMLQTWGRTAERCGLKLVEAPMEQESGDNPTNPFECPIPIKLALKHPPTKGFYKPVSTSSAASTHTTGGEDAQDEPVQVPKYHFLTELVKMHGFILDMESDELYPPMNQMSYSYKRSNFKNLQYVHRSGVAFIQVCCDGPFEFLWANNRLLTSHVMPAGGAERGRRAWDRPAKGSMSSEGGGPTSKTASNQIPHPDILRAKFQQTCSDRTELARIWDEISSHLETVSGIQDILEDVPDENVVEREGRAWVMPSLAAPRRKSEAEAAGSEESGTGTQDSTSGASDEGAAAAAVAAPREVPTIRIEIEPASPEDVRGGRRMGSAASRPEHLYHHHQNQSPQMSESTGETTTLSHSTTAVMTASTVAKAATFGADTVTSMSGPNVDPSPLRAASPAPSTGPSTPVLSPRITPALNLVVTEPKQGVPSVDNVTEVSTLDLSAQPKATEDS